MYAKAECSLPDLAHERQHFTKAQKGRSTICRPKSKGILFTAANPTELHFKVTPAKSRSRHRISQISKEETHASYVIGTSQAEGLCQGNKQQFTAQCSDPPQFKLNVEAIPRLYRHHFHVQAAAIER